MIEPSKTLPPKYLSIIIVTIAEAKILAKLFPTKIADKSWSGLFKRFKARLALVFDFLDKFLSLILLAAIMPVSEPEKKPLIINKHISVENRNIKEGSSSIMIQLNTNSYNKLLEQPT